jgi:hypothetical protein
MQVKKQDYGLEISLYLNPPNWSKVEWSQWVKKNIDAGLTKQIPAKIGLALLRPEDLTVRKLILA